MPRETKAERVERLLEEALDALGELPMEKRMPITMKATHRMVGRLGKEVAELME